MAAKGRIITMLFDNGKGYSLILLYHDDSEASLA